MKMLMIRHAARSLHGLGDTSLSPQGRAQAEHLAQMVSQGLLSAPSRLLSSPKKRAKETLESLSLASQIPITIDPRLDERHQNEISREFEARVQSFIDELSSPENSIHAREACIMICSHLDWLELAMTLLPSTLSDFEIASSWTNAEYRIFRLADGLWKLTGSGVAEP